MDRIKKFGQWYVTTAAWLGVPMLFVLIILGAQKTFYTATCEIAEYRCEKAIGASDAMAQFMGDLVSSNDAVDIVAKKRK